MPTNSNSPAFETVDQVEEFLTTRGDSDIINVWNNLQESFAEESERLSWFNRIASKRGLSMVHALAR